MIVDVGDAPTVVWHPLDDDGEPINPVTVVATLTAPGGAVTNLAVTHAAVGDYRVTPAFTAAGDWTLTWTSTSPAEVHADQFAALLAPETAPWAPDLRRVGSHIPSRTRSLDSPDQVLGTFSDDTEPTGEQVTEIIGSAVATVAGFVGRPVVPAAYPLCETAAALWASYWTELSWPGRDADVSVFGRLRDDAILLMNQAKAVNLGAGGGTDDIPDTDGVPNALPSWSFPLSLNYSKILGIG